MIIRYVVFSQASEWVFVRRRWQVPVAWHGELPAQQASLARLHRRRGIWRLRGGALCYATGCVCTTVIPLRRCESAILLQIGAQKRGDRLPSGLRSSYWSRLKQRQQKRVCVDGCTALDVQLEATKTPFENIIILQGFKDWRHHTEKNKRVIHFALQSLSKHKPPPHCWVFITKSQVHGC